MSASLETESITCETSSLSQNEVVGETSSTKTLSKRDRRRLSKQEIMLKYRPERRMREREQKKIKRRLAREAGEILIAPTRKACKNNQMCHSSCHIRVAIDCSFDDYMNDRDIMRLDKQLTYCYSVNRRAVSPMQYYVCSIDGKIKERLESIGAYHYWDVYKKEASYLEIFNKDEIVYLTGDSDNVLTDLTPDKVYVIGGLIDHNHHKGLCHELAVKRGIYHARLPLSEHISMKTRSILTINHVFDILLRYTVCGDWKEAFLSAIPQRKGASCQPEGLQEKCPSTKPDTPQSENLPAQITALSANKDNDKSEMCLPNDTPTTAAASDNASLCR